MDGSSSAARGVRKSSVDDVPKGLSDEVGMFKQEALERQCKAMDEEEWCGLERAENLACAKCTEVFGWFGERDQEA